MGYPLANRVIVITGAGRGLGKILAQHFSSLDAKLGLIARNHTQLETIQRELPEESISVSCDVTNEDEIVDGFNLIYEKFGHIDSVVANAGGLRAAHRAEKFPAEKWREVVELNLTGAYLTARTAYNYLRASYSGRMVFVSSAAVKAPPRGSSAYVAAKAGVEGLTKALGVEWADDNILVNTLVPGFMNDGEAIQINDKTTDRIINRTAIRRPGNVSDLATAAAFLAGDSCGYITGQSLSVDGGYGLA